MEQSVIMMVSCSPPDNHSTIMRHCDTDNHRIITCLPFIADNALRSEMNVRKHSGFKTVVNKVPRLPLVSCFQKVIFQYEFLFLLPR